MTVCPAGRIVPRMNPLDAAATAPATPTRPSSPLPERGDDVLRLKHLTLVTGLSRSQLRRLRVAGDFPPHIRLSIGAIGWRRRDISEWLERRKVEM